MAKSIEGKYLLALAANPKIGSQTLKKITAAFADPAEIWQISGGEIRSKLGEKIALNVVEARKKFNPDEEISKLSKLDVGYITMYDKEYPPLLREIPDYPVILFVRGDPKVLNMPSIAVVGSRKYSTYGAKVATTLTGGCTSNGLVIVSGLALGIDAIAHRSALDNWGITVGVVGCGLDRIYPVSNYQLGEEIISSGGTIISEFPLGVPPMKQNFPMRNRIIAGLALGTLVIEAAESSGSLITAGLALEYNREVFAVPGNIDSQTSAGTNKLIKDGAIPVTEAGDILKVLNIEEKTNQTKSREILPETDEEKKIAEALANGEKSGDELVHLTKLNVISLNMTLTTMEMKGMIENIGGGRYKLK
ncbi:DNA-protecting protein DprA [Candidatus Berkelbacteria bacterium CG10_big_fil_rev_8_21_14_0_10_43_13]|uniref:DNA-protecting protein DprA n=1 Tax=Candidatus Berkelbacteria bacterium CG10_big_fil_rev_8_21_14_0_10_43_13 TaxID=1974514 RepID=A0A2H0W6V6_9BACT|nr:MAG: DNA-protecting protein DprA [Candidatus Berkelbacteria bacterium CG10_big_fil_rev_8_21_14_0_10_43_13]